MAGDKKETVLADGRWTKLKAMLRPARETGLQVLAANDVEGT